MLTNKQFLFCQKLILCFLEIFFKFQNSFKLRKTRHEEIWLTWVSFLQQHAFLDAFNKLIKHIVQNPLQEQPTTRNQVHDNDSFPVKLSRCPARLNSETNIDTHSEISQQSTNSGKESIPFSCWQYFDEILLLIGKQRVKEGNAELLEMWQKE